MKKKIISILLVATMAVTILAGCGNADGTVKVSKSDTMTISEMLDAVLEDSGGEVNIYCRYSESKEVLGKDFPCRTYSYDGKTVKILKSNPSNTLGDIANGNAEKADLHAEYGVEPGLCIRTDETGNTANLEILACGGIEKVDGNVRTGDDGAAVFFGSFSRIEVYDKTYMCFTMTVYPASYSPYDTYTLIEDTKSTKDKTIVFDTVGTDGVLVDEVDISSSIYKAK